ncbi:hypothetical protein P22_2220 [Propionispora sp. 2/2-37]|uniref:RNase P modulator RnpM n=1 Tax=Propionispora sp. 2/2-37 TaxID=1677858 RepID=UPI0006BB7ECA|nr:YlxR family protein [Propionispora sp. 2/2-37]CUH96132.1 hypothetical protein P22_2220 [Propionispora sp. 2/2-37]
MQKKKIPQRMCVGCQEMKSKRELLRIVRTPAGSVEWDPSGKKSGRGAYICPSEECLGKAVKQKRLEKALSQSIEDEVYEILRSGIKNS